MPPENPYQYPVRKPSFSDFQRTAPRSGGEVLLNLLAQGIAGGKQKKQQTEYNEEITRILGSGSRDDIIKAASTSSIPQMQQLAFSELLRQPKSQDPKNPFGGGERGTWMYTAFTKPGTKEGQAAYERLKAPKEVYNATTGDTTIIKGYVTPTIAALYENQSKAAAGEVDAGTGTAGPGAEQLTERTSVIKGRGKAATADESKSMGFANRMLGAEDIQTELTASGFDPAALSVAAWEAATDNVFTPELIVQSQLPQDVKRYLGSKLDFITAVLRKESGAAIGKEEYVKENKKYFPQANDGPKVLEDKRQRRRAALKSMGVAGGQRFEKDFPDQYGMIFGEETTEEALSPEDQEALEWAEANPKDPRAAKIKAQLGR